MKKDLIFFLLVVTFLGGCSASKQLLISSSADLSETEIIDFPPINVSTTNVLGDTLASKGFITTTPAVKFLSEITYSKKNSLKPRHFVRKGSKGKFTKVHTVVSTGEKISCLDIRVDWDTGAGTQELCKGSSGEYKWWWEYIVEDVIYPEIVKKVHVPFSSREQIEELMVTELNSPTFVQQFIYNGRVGSALKFIYREFSGDYIKPAFTQEVQYDLSQSETIGFKGLKMSILNASNTEITYTLHSNF